MRVAVTAVSHTGLVREHNEDAFVVGGLVSSGTMPVERPVVIEVDDSGPLLCAVADGLGGHEGGEVASSMVVSLLSEQARRCRGETDIAELVRAANVDLYEAMADDPKLAGMGTTLACLLFVGSEVIWANVGDSRAYLYVGGELRQLTEDDSPAGPRGGSRTSLVLQTVGGLDRHETIKPHTGREQLDGGELLVVCSDGLTDVVDDDVIGEVLAAADVVPDGERATDHDRTAVAGLLQRALDAGGPDNCTVLVARVLSAAGDGH